MLCSLRVGIPTGELIHQYIISYTDKYLACNLFCYLPFFVVNIMVSIHMFQRYFKNIQMDFDSIKRP